jgi:deoxycytidylate deaminase
MLINAGVSEIVIAEGYPDKLAMKVLKEAGMRTRVFARKKA